MGPDYDRANPALSPRAEIITIEEDSDSDTDARIPNDRSDCDQFGKIRCGNMGVGIGMPGSEGQGTRDNSRELAERNESELPMNQQARKENEHLISSLLFFWQSRAAPSCVILDMGMSP